ncbi:MAG: DUF362 domain-containing protein [Treponema sp.]|jgi:uncharacterized protein (DUF362 family)|nr:DUF362 domain-containing protein [Treponema sp.]
MKKLTLLLALVIVVVFTTCNPTDKTTTGEESTYTISFDNTGGTGGQTATVTATYGKPMPPIAAVPTPVTAGDTFTGYWDAASGGKKYYNADKTSASNWDKEADATLYAQFTSTPIEPTQVEPSIVSLVQSTTVTQAANFTYAEIKSMVTEAVRLAGGLEGIIKAGDTVVLKPNVIVTNYSWNTSASVIPVTVNGVCTDWRVVQATAELVREIVGAKGAAGAGRILVIEGSGKGSTATNFTNIGYTTTNLSAVDEIIALDNEGVWVGAGDATGNQASYVTAVQLDNYLYKTAPSGNYASYFKNGTYYINKKMYEADAVICLPVVKNHWNAVVTGAIKNISIGAAPPRVYGISGTDIGRNNMINHNTVEFHQWIADYFSCIPADFVVMDGLQGLQKGPLPGGSSEAAALTPNQKNLRSILASKDALAIDTVETNIINWDYTTVKYLSFLNQRGEVGTKPGKPKITLRGDPKDIVVLGNKKVDDLRTTFNGESSMGGEAPMAGGVKLTQAQLTKPTVTINSAAFSGVNLNLNLTLSSGANNNVVKIDVYIDGTYKKSFNTDMVNVSLDASSLAAGSHNIEVRAFTKFMSGATASTTATR